MARPLFVPNDISQFVVKAEVVSKNGGRYYCDGAPSHRHAVETTFSFISPKHYVEYVGYIVVQCLECKAMYTFSHEVPKTIKILR